MKREVEISSLRSTVSNPNFLAALGAKAFE